jgi:hypothetical protein
MDFCKKVEKIKTGANDVPVLTVKIAECGELSEDQKLNNEQCEF